MSGNVVNIVSGLPRSGTSMMMRMIGAAGIEPLTDGLRQADEDNPLGYAELEAVKRTREDASWLVRAPGRVVKLVHILLRDLPATHSYRVVMMHRDLDEVLASQRKMLERSGKPGSSAPDQTLRQIFASQLREVERWVGEQPNFRMMTVNYGDVVRQPGAEAARVAAFLGVPDRAAAMAGAVDASLYRNRK